MNAVRSLLIASLLAAPTLAHAQWGVIGTHETDTDKCKGMSKKAGKVMDKWKPELGGKDTRKAWKELIDVGAGGCDAILEHMNAGGEGFESADWADIGALFVASGVDPYAAAGRGLLLKGDPKINEEILDALEPKMVQLTADEAKSVSSVDSADARKDALSVLIGHHSEGQMTSTMGVPYWKETAWWGATKAPEAHQIEAVQHVIDAGDADTRKTAADYIGRLFTEGNANQEGWAPTLAGFLAGTGDDQDAANLAARGLGAAKVDGKSDYVDTILGTGNKDTIDYLIQGLELRLGAGRGDKSDLDLLQRVSEKAEGPLGKKAEKLVKKFSKTVK
jgi:hypothetical protein